MKHGLFRELKRRHVYRVAIAYAVVGWLVIQLASTVFPAFGAPAWVLKVVIALIVIGFPVALVLAWAFEMTPEGVRRTEPSDSPDARAPEQNSKVGHTLDRVIIGVLIVAVAFMAWRMWAPHEKASGPSSVAAAASLKTPARASVPASAASAIPAKSIAVLPFENLSSDKNNAYFADGMQDLILTKLADIGGLKVISRTSTMQYGSHPQNLKQIGKELGVTTLLEGSVQKSGDQVLVNVQLINADTDSHIWADSYQRTLKNVFGVEGEVAGKIADALKTKLSPEEAKRLATSLSNDPKANVLYLRAERYWDSTGKTDKTVTSTWKKAIPFYRQALARAPDFALAHARLSYVESMLAGQGGGGEDVKTLFADARTHAELAIKLAPDQADSYLALGTYELFAQSDYDAALKAYATGLQIRPNDALLYVMRGEVLADQGRYDEFVKAAKRAWMLDPRNLISNYFLAQAYMAVGRYDRAEQMLQQALALNPRSIYAQLRNAQCILLSTGNVGRALAALHSASAPLNIIRSNYLADQRKFRAAIALTKTIPDKAFKAIFGLSAYKNMNLGDLYRWSGDTASARAYYAKALPAIHAWQASLVQHVAIANTWLTVADAELGLGHTEKGIAAIKTALSVREKIKDHNSRRSILTTSAERYAQAGNAKEAVSLIARALNTPGITHDYSPVMLWIDPAWDPIRKTPQFQALLKKYAKDKPASMITQSAHG